MSDLPVASSTANHNQQGEKRKRDSEQPQPPPQNPGGHAVSTTRQRIVEILSNTANGCLSELGYFPGMPMRLKELEAQNLTWRDENVKLFEDNRRLLNTVKTLNANISLSNLPESGQLQKVMELASEVQQLQAENERIRKLIQVPESLQTEYAKLYESHTNLQKSFGVLHHENQALKEQLRSFMHPQMGQQVLQNNPGRQVQPIPIPSNVQRGGMALPHIQTQPMIQLHGQPRLSASPVTNSQSQNLQRSNIHGQRSELSQTQNAVLHNKQQSHPNTSSRRSSLNLVSPSLHPYQQFSPQLNDPAMQFNSGSRMQSSFEQQHPNPGTSRRMIPIGTNLQQNLRRASVPVVYRNGNPYSAVQGGHPDSSRMNYNAPEPPPRSASTTTSNQSRRTETPPTPLSASHILAQQSHFAPPTSNSPSLHPIERNVQPMATTISPQDTYIRPPDVPQAQSDSSAVISPQPLVAAPHQQNVPIQDAEQMHAIPFGGSSSGSVPPAETGTSSVSSSSGPPSGPESQTVPEVNNASTDAQSQSAGSSNPEPVAQTQNAMQVDAPKDDEEVEEESEIGLDGLRLVKICIEDLFGKPVDGRVTCKLCWNRYLEGIQAKELAYFDNATDEELVAHAIAEHEHPWEHLRQPETEETEDEAEPEELEGV